MKNGSMIVTPHQTVSFHKILRSNPWELQFNTHFFIIISLPGLTQQKIVWNSSLLSEVLLSSSLNSCVLEVCSIFQPLRIERKNCGWSFRKKKISRSGCYCILAQMIRPLQKLSASSHPPRMPVRC